jgi:type I restriction enzyme S subunit
MSGPGQTCDTWEIDYRLGDGCTFKHGFAFKGEFMTTEDSEDHLPIVVNIVNFQYTGGFRFESTKVQRYSGLYPPEYELRPGDILVVMTCQTPKGEILGVPGRIPLDGEKYLHNQRMGLAILTNAAVLDLGFLYYLFLSSPFNQHLYKTATGAKILHTAPGRIENFRFSRPPLSTQRRIASILSAYDDLIENNTRRIKILEEMAEMIYREWFVSFRFPGHEHVKMVKSEIGLIPEGWKAGLLRDVCESIDYGYTASAVKKPIGPKLLRITDIVPDTIDWPSVPHCPPPERNPQKYSLLEGDIVVARTGATTGYAKRLNKHHPESIFASYLVRLRVKPEHSNHMIGLLVESDDYKRFIKANLGGAAQPQANAQVLTSIPIAIPPLQVQRKFSDILKPFLDQKEILQIKNGNLRQTRDMLLPKLISGDVGVEHSEAEGVAQGV